MRTAALLRASCWPCSAAVLWGGWTWTQRQYYVGATPDGMVAVFQGIPGQIAGLHLSRVHHTER